MKVSREQAAKNRDRILDAAGRLIRERGMGCGVDALTAAAGLSHGSLYSQFGSKERLITEALSHAGAGRAQKRAAARIRADDFVANYLSRRHRDNPGTGCVLATLGADIARQARPVRRTFARIVMENMAWLGGQLSGGARRREDEALQILSTMVGAMVLARAVDDPALSARILDVNRQTLQDRLAQG